MTSSSFPDLSAYTARCDRCHAAMVPGVSSRLRHPQAATDRLCDRCEASVEAARARAREAVRAARHAQAGYPPLGYTPRSSAGGAADLAGRAVGCVVMIGLCAAFGAVRDCACSRRSRYGLERPDHDTGRVTLREATASPLGCSRQSGPPGCGAEHVRWRAVSWAGSALGGSQRPRHRAMVCSPAGRSPM